MKPTRIEGRLEIYDAHGPTIYVCIDPTCREAAVYKVRDAGDDPGLDLFYCEGHITADDIDVAEWLGIAVTP